jgi:hypothetical protein
MLVKYGKTTNRLHFADRTEAIVQCLPDEDTADVIAELCHQQGWEMSEVVAIYTVVGERRWYDDFFKCPSCGEAMDQVASYAEQDGQQIFYRCGDCESEVTIYLRNQPVEEVLE